MVKEFWSKHKVWAISTIEFIIGKIIEPKHAGNMRIILDSSSSHGVSLKSNQ